MRKAVDDKHVRQLRAQLVVGFCHFPFAGIREDFWFLHRIRREECGVITAFTHGQGDKALFRQFKLTTVSDQNFGWDFGLNLPHRFIEMNREIVNRAATLRPNNIRAPTVLGEAVGQAGR